MLRTLWLQRLSTRIQKLLSVLDDVSLDKLAICADKATERGSSSTVVAVVNKSPSDLMQEIKKQVEELIKTIAAIGRSRSRSKSRSGRMKSKKRSRFSSNSHSGICYYHRRFKERHGNTFNRVNRNNL